MNRRAYALGVAMVLLCSLAAVALRSFAEATFLDAYGRAQMPWLLIATAAGFAVATVGYDALAARVHARVVDLGLLAALGVLAGAAPALLRAGVSPVALVVGLTAASQVAGLALWNRVAASVAGRDARRMLPRAGAAVTAGGAIAGLAAAPAIPALGLAALPYASAAVTVVVIALSIAQERALARGGAPGGAPVVAGADASVPALSTLQRQLVAALLATAVLEGIVTTTIDLQFVGTVKARYTGDDVAVALALFYGATNAVLLALQLAAVPRLLVTRSLPFTAAIHPLLVIASYAVFAAAPGFVGIAGARTTDQVFRLATSRTSQELALSALPPLPRARWKVRLRGVAWPAGAAASASVLLAIGPHVLREPERIAAAAIGVAIVWGIVARLAARRFQAALRAPLGMSARARGPQRGDRLIDLDALERWTHAAGSPDAQLAALARACLARARVAPADLADHLRHDEPAVRAAMFDQLARVPAAELRGELRAAVAIEDDDRALALGIAALALAGDDSALERGRGRAGLSKDVDAATAGAAAMLRGTNAAAEFRALLARDPTWAGALARARAADIGDDALAVSLQSAAAAPETRANALAVIARTGPPATLPILRDALAAGEPAARYAFADLDADSAACLARALRDASSDEAAWPQLARIALARASAAAPEAGELVAELVADRDPEVAHAALRTALAIGVPSTRAVAAHDAALAALVAHLDARDGSAAWSACARAELAIATRRAVGRLLWAAAVDAATAGRDPAPLAATARHLAGGRDADRKRALDVAQELDMRPAVLAALERWLAATTSTIAAAADNAALAAVDPWLAELAAGKLAALEPTLTALRRPALFATIAGPALAELASRATPRRVDGAIFATGASGDELYVVVAGTLLARRAGAPDRRIEAGGVVGEVAVLTHAPRAADLVTDGEAELLAIDRATFAAAARRAPELVLGLSATLAGWLAPNRPDVL